MADVALVTGARGFIGRHVARALAASGSCVIGLGHGHWQAGEAQNWGLTHWHEGDVKLQTLLALGCQPDRIVHCAGSGSVGFSMSHPFEDFERSVASTAAVLEFMRLECPLARLAIASSAGVYGKASQMPISIGAPLSPASPYGVHKKLVEDLCQSYARHSGLKIAIVRLFSVFGIGLRKQLLWDACSKLAAGESSFFGSGLETRDWVHIEDAVQLLLLATHHADTSCPVVNGGSGTAVTIRQIVERLAARLECGLHPSFSGAVRAGDPVHYHADVSEALAWGWQPQHTLSAELDRYAHWYKEGAS